MSNVQIETRDGLLTLEIRRPPVNALNMACVKELLAGMQKAKMESSIRCVLLTGSEGVFCAGHDIHEMLEAQDQQISYRMHLMETYNPLILAIRHLEKPVVAAINGPVAGAGLGIALACDLRIASEEAHFTVGFSGIGLVPDSGVSLFLPLLVGLGRATELSFSNASLTAQQALEWGLINRVVPKEKLMTEARHTANHLAKGPTGTFGLTKQAFNNAMLPNLEQILNNEATLQEKASKSQEHQAGTRAFLDKKIPDFS